MSFTPEQITEILQIYFDNFAHQTYTGMRYVPIFGRRGETSIAWDNSEPYEPLTIVTYNNESYTSRQYVPAAVAITDTDYWAKTGAYNAQIAALQDALPIAQFDSENTVKDYVDTLASFIPASDFDNDNTVKAYIDATNDLLPATDFDSVNTVKEYIDGFADMLPSSAFDSVNTVRGALNGRVRAFETVADMAAATDLATDMICHTNGFHTSGDGGAAFYEIKSTGTANAMDIIACQDSLLAHLVITEPFVTPEQFGAYGDGIENDTNALQAAINTEFKIILTQTYLTNQILVKGINNINIQGLNNPTLLYANTDVNNSSSWNGSYMLSNREEDDTPSTSYETAYINGITFDMQKDAFTNYSNASVRGWDIFYLVNYDNIEISNCTFKNSFMDAVYLASCSNISIHDNNFINIGNTVGQAGSRNALSIYDIVFVPNNDTIYKQPKLLTVYNNTFKNIQDEGLRISGYYTSSIYNNNFVSIGEFVLEPTNTRDNKYCQVNFYDNCVNGCGSYLSSTYVDNLEDMEINIHNNVLVNLGCTDYGITSIDISQGKANRPCGAISDTKTNFIYNICNNKFIWNTDRVNTSQPLFYTKSNKKIFIDKNTVSVTNSTGTQPLFYIEQAQDAECIISNNHVDYASGNFIRNYRSQLTVANNFVSSCTALIQNMGNSVKVEKVTGNKAAYSGTSFISVPDNGSITNAYIVNNEVLIPSAAAKYIFNPYGAGVTLGTFIAIGNTIIGSTASDVLGGAQSKSTNYYAEANFK